MTLKKTAFHTIHQELGARMVPFAGWDLPVQFGGAMPEHRAVREALGVFDVSHMGELEISGPDALLLVQKVTCNDAAKLADAQAQYSAFLTPEGTFIDDVVIYRLAAERFLICVNAANREKDFRWVRGQSEGRVEVADRSDDFVQLAVQGPRAQAVLQKLTEIDLAKLSFYHCAEGMVADTETLISRTGYTGEDGFEIYFSPRHAEKVWTRLFEAGEEEGIQPAGLAARNTLRLEVRYALYGNDIDETTTPLEAGLGWIVKLDKDDFIGKQALLEQKKAGVGRKLTGFEMVDRGIARDHYPVFMNGKVSGNVTSGSYCPSIEKAVGLTYLPAESSAVGTELEVEIRGRHLKARVVPTPFYKRPKS